MTSKGFILRWAITLRAAALLQVNTQSRIIGIVLVSQEVNACDVLLTISKFSSIEVVLV